MTELALPPSTKTAGMFSAGAKRRWPHSVAGRLLIAFFLIVALTVAGTVQWLIFIK